jgi:uncharacterized protein Yka (UPF0111/DUF47 family)
MTYDDLLDAREWAERAVRELRDELLEHTPEEDWDDSMIQEINDAENEVDYLQNRLDTGDYEE